MKRKGSVSQKKSSCERSGGGNCRLPVKSPMQLKHSSRFRRSPRNGEVPAQPPPPAPFASGPQGFIFGALGGVPSRGRGQPGRGGVGNPGHLSRGTQQPLRQEGSARQPSSDKTHRPLRRGTPTRSQAFPPPGHSPHQLGAVLHLSAGRRAAPARRRRPPAAEPRPREPAAGARRPCQAVAGPRPQPAPRHGGGRHCCPPLLPSRQSARPRRASPMLALNGEGTGRWHPRTGGVAPGFCGRRAAFCCPANGVRRAGFASVSPGCRGGHCRRRFEVHSRAPWETRHFGF